MASLSDFTLLAAVYLFVCWLFWVFLWGSLRLLVGSQARPGEIAGFACTPFVLLSPTQVTALFPESPLSEPIWYLGDWIGIVWAIWIVVQALSVLAPGRRVRGAIGFAIPLIVMAAFSWTLQPLLLE
jgi:hypothetical protein